MHRRRPPRLARIGLVFLCSIRLGSDRAAADDPPEAPVLVGTAPEKYNGRGADRSGRKVYALRSGDQVFSDGRCDVLNPRDGPVIRSFKTKVDGCLRIVRVARLGDGGLGLVGVQERQEFSSSTRPTGFLGQSDLIIRARGLQCGCE